MNTDLDKATDDIVSQITEIVKRFLEKQAATTEGDFFQLERDVLELVRDLGTQIMEGVLQLRGSGNEGSTRPCGCGGQQKHSGNRPRRMTTLVGEVDLQRAYYRCEDCGETAYPLDEQLGLGSGYLSRGLQEALGELTAALPFRSATRLLDRLTGVKVSAKTAQANAIRLGRHVLQTIEQRAEAVFSGDAVVEAEGSPETLYVAMDGTKVRTEEGFREAKAGAIYEAKGGEHSGETTYVGGYWPAEQFGDLVCIEATGRGCDDAKQQVVLGDGAKWIWNIAEVHFPQAVQILDWYHVERRVWEVGEALYGEGNDRTRQWVEQKLDKLWAGQAGEVIAQLGEQSTEDDDAREKVRELRVYFANNRHRMLYPRYIAMGFDVGSGVVESACKHLVAQRQKLAGICWSLIGAGAVLALRTLVINNRWRQFFRKHPPPRY